MRALYAERQEMLLALVASELDDFVEGERMEAGMHLVAWMRPPLNEHLLGMDRRVAAAALEEGVAAVALTSLSTNAPCPAALLLGFSAHDPATMRRGVECLRRAARRTTLRSP